MASDDFLSKEVTEFRAQNAEDARRFLASFISDDAMAGDLLALDYEEAAVLVHDSMRRKIGGLPMGCFLLSTRLAPSSGSDATGPNPNDEDTALILLRVVGRAQLPNRADTDKYRLDAARRAIDSPENWDTENKTDQFTLNQLRHAGVRCAVLGTFRMEQLKDNWRLGFGADISNFYSGQGMKVYKPMGNALSRIVNFTKPTGDRHPLPGKPVPVGRVRYCSSEIAVNAKRDNVPVTMYPTDLLARRTALFGMSRSGKSNTIKTVSAAIFMLRDADPNLGRIGQLIFDTNGEYCNDNPQDNGCLRNVWRETQKTAQGDVVTYGLHPHPNDLNRRLVKVNFFGEAPTAWSDRESVASAMDMLLAGKAIIDESMPTEGAHYVKNFLNTRMEPPLDWDEGNQTRYRRHVAVYRALLARAGFALPQGMEQADIHSLFGKDVRAALVTAAYKSAADTLGQTKVSWAALHAALTDLQKISVQQEGARIQQRIL